MGRLNKDLIQKCERARKAGDAEQLALLIVQIAKSQNSCPHPEEAKKSSLASKASSNGKIRPGDRVCWCLDCSKLLHSERDNVTFLWSRS